MKIKKILLLTIYFSLIQTSFAQKGFVENKGQIADFNGGLHPEILYSYHAQGLNLYFKKEGLSYYFYDTEELETINNESDSPVKKTAQQYAPKLTESYYHRMDMLFSNGNISTVQIEASDKNTFNLNYYLPHCSDGILSVNNFKTLKYVNIYNFIDFTFNITPTGIKYDIIIRPGANPEDIKLLFDGVSSLEKISSTEILIKTPVIEFSESMPLSFYSSTHEKVDCEFILEENTISFAVPNYNNTELIIDPIQYWSTFFDFVDGSSQNSARPVFDKDGLMYSATNVNSSGFPVLNAGGGQYFNSAYSDQGDIVVYKFGPNNNIMWATFYGSTRSDQIGWPGRALAIDSANHIFLLLNIISGNATGSFFPTYNPGGGAFYQDQTRMFDFYNSAILEFNSAGVRQWATALSHEAPNTSPQDFLAWGISAKNNKVYITGQTGTYNSNTPPYRSYPGGYYNTTEVGNVSPFVARFTNRNLDWLTNVNAGVGSANYNAQGWDIEEDKNGEIIMVGNTLISAPTNGHLLINPGSGAYYQSAYVGYYKILITKFGTNLQPYWSTYYGGNSLDQYEGMTISNNNELILVGYTNSSNFPLYNPGGGAYFRASNASNNFKNSFIVKFGSNNAVNWATTYSDSMIMYGVATDAYGQIYVNGAAEGNGTNIPTLFEPGSYNDATANGGYFDNYFAKFSSTGVHQWGTFYGGTGYDSPGVAGRNALNIYSDTCVGTKIVFFGRTYGADFPTQNPGGGALFQGTRTSSGVGSTSVPVIVQFIQPIISPCALGIELIDFKGICSGNTISFNWSTSSESGNSHFILEKSENGLSYEPIETINGKGFTNSINHYQSRIFNSNPTFNYYRLKQVDFDGEISFSKIQYLNCNSLNNNGITVFPNPTSNLLNITLSEERSVNLSISIFDMTGKQIRTYNYNAEVNETITLPLQGLENGNYFISIKDQLSDKVYPYSKFSVTK